MKFMLKEILCLLRILNLSDVGMLVYVFGIVIATLKARIKVKYMAFEC